MMKSETSTPGSSGAPDAVLAPLEAVTRRVGHGNLAERLNALRSWLADDLGELERAIQATTDMGETLTEDAEYGELAVKAARYLLARPGKRIRPIVVTLGARLGGRGLDREVRDLATACELVHNATLLHDDVIDEGTERRGAPTARMVFGNSASVLAGDHLLIHALQLVEGVGYRRLLSSMLETIGEMVTAEAVQLEQRGRLNPDRDVYLRVVQGKTAGLFRWGFIAGATAAGLDGDTLATLGRCGNALGIAFQLMDDVLDVTGDPAVTGKDVLADLREGKLTWPFILASEADSGLLPLMKDALVAIEKDPGGGHTPGELALRILERVRATNAVAETRAFAAAQAELAVKALRTLPDSVSRRALEAVIESAVSRSA
ncbi:MAG: polyprenyl synthetase family protein [Myxococcales bacterium]|nr:polyprenyl synthetase family protein [Myxococcales bacterium]